MPPKNKERWSFRDVKDVLEMAKEQLKTKEDVIKDVLAAKDIDIKNVEKLYEQYPDDTFDGITDDNLIADAFNLIAGDTTESYLSDYEGDREESRYMLMKALIIDVLKEWREILADRNKIASIDTEFNDMVKEQEEYVTSERFDQDKEKRVDDLKDKIAECQAHMIGDAAADYLPKKEKAKYEREAKVITQRYSLEYLYARLDDPKTGESEVHRLMNSFFDNSRSRYIMKRYHSHMEQLRLPADAINKFINIEERFLEPEFHVYNNFYLFFIATCVAYSDVNVPREIKQPLQNLTSLVYNKFSSDKAKEVFMDSIRGFLQRFADYRDVFSEKNITNPHHPHRIEKEAERKATYKNRLLHMITTTEPSLANIDGLDKKSIEELESILQAATEAKIEGKATDEDNSSSEQVTPSDEKVGDGVVKLNVSGNLSNTQIPDAATQAACEPLSSSGKLPLGTAEEAVKTMICEQDMMTKSLNTEPTNHASIIGVDVGSTAGDCSDVCSCKIGRGNTTPIIIPVDTENGGPCNPEVVKQLEDEWKKHGMGQDEYAERIQSKKDAVSKVGED